MSNKTNWWKVASAILAGAGIFQSYQSIIPQLNHPVVNVVLVGVIGGLGAIFNTRKDKQ